MRRIRASQSELPLPAFKALVREQFYMLLLDAEACLAAIPMMLPDDVEMRRKAFALIEQILSARGGELSAEDSKRLRRLAELFGVDDASAVIRRSVSRDGRKEPRAKARSPSIQP